MTMQKETTWHGKLQVRAAQLRFNPQTLAAAIQQEMRKLDLESASITLPPALVAQWMNGLRAPETPELHRALMHALKLPYTISLGSKTADSGRRDVGRDLKSGSLDENLAEQRYAMETLYADVPAAKKVTELAPSARRQRIDAGNKAVHVPGNLGTAYRTQNELEKIMKETADPAQYMECFWRLKGCTLDELGELLLSRSGAHTTVSDYVAGHNLPDLDKLASLKRAMGAHYSDYEPLVIAKRLSNAAQFAKDGRGEPANQFSEMPPSYWVTLLEARRNMVVTHRPSQKEILWKGAMVPIQTKGEYLRSMRKAWGLTANQVGEATGLSEPYIREIETGDNNHMVESREKLAQFYEGGEAKKLASKNPDHMLLIKEAPPRFDRQAYEGRKRTPHTRVRPSGMPWTTAIQPADHAIHASAGEGIS